MDIKICVVACYNSKVVFKSLNELGLINLDVILTEDYGPSLPNLWMYDQCMLMTHSNKHDTIIIESDDFGEHLIKKFIGATLIKCTHKTECVSALSKLIHE